MNLKEFLISQAKKAGIGDDAEFNLMVSASSLGEIEVPSAVINKFDNNLFNIDIAKANINLKNHFISDFMMGYDEELIKMAKEYGLPHEMVEEIKSTKSSGQKVKLAMKSLKELEEKAKNANPNLSEEYVRKIAEAQTKLDEAVARAEEEKRMIEGRFTSRMQELWERAQLSNVAWNEAIPEAARIHTYKSVLNDKLNSLGGKIVYDSEHNTSRLVNANDEKLPLVVSGKEFSYSDLQTLVLQENKLLRETGNGGSTSVTQGTQFSTPTSGSGTPLKIPSYVSGALADITRVAKEIGDN